MLTNETLYLLKLLLAAKDASITIWCQNLLGKTLCMGKNNYVIKNPAKPTPFSLKNEKESNKLKKTLLWQYS